MSDYDAIVIGSGSGGLAAATALARAGRKVVVFEQHAIPGGYSQTFTLRGFRFSPGVHYVGGLGPGGRLRQIYEGLGIANDLVFLEINPDGYDHAIVGDERFDFPKGRERLTERLQRRFPEEAEGIADYLDVMCRISEEIGRVLPAEGLLDEVLLPIRMPTLVRYGLLPLSSVLERFTRSPLLRAILSIQSGDHGMPPSRAPTALHVGIIGYYLDGACYPRGGAGTIAAAFVNEISRRGGEVRLRTAVDRILLERGRVGGVRLRDGTEVAAPVVVSNADPGVTWGRLVGLENVSRSFRRRIERTRYSVSTLSLFLAVDLDLRAAGLDSGNCWFSRTTDIEAVYEFAKRADLGSVDRIPAAFVSATTLKDPSLRQDGLHTIEALALASYDAFTGPGYAALKEHLAEKMLDVVEEIAPGIRDHVVFRALGTPLTNERFVGVTRGGIYGTEKTLRNLGPLGFPVRTEIGGLYECGASTLSPGVLGVTTSGLFAAGAVLGCPADELLDPRGQALRVHASEAPPPGPAREAPRRAGAPPSPARPAR